MTNGHIETSDWLLSHLAPLLRGEAVKLVVEQSRTHGRKTVNVQKGLLIAPGSAYGLSNQAVVVSLLGSGSCVIFPDAQHSKGELVNAGLPVELATALIEKLSTLFGDTKNGPTTQPTTSTRRSYRSR